VPHLRLPAIHFPTISLSGVPSPSLLAVATLLLGLALVAMVRRGRRTPADFAVALARRGRPVTSIARRTRLSQDVVRDLLGGEPVAVSTVGLGRFFRRRKAATAEATDSFADELSERCFDAKS
jgi:hypothetical protein